MEWYKSIEFWVGTVITLAFFLLFFNRTFGALWWINVIFTIVGMLLVMGSFKKLNIK